MPVGNNNELSFTGRYSYNSGYFFDPDNVVRQEAFSVVNDSVEFSVHGSWGVELWARNLNNAHYAAQKLTSATGTSVIYAAPRTYGATFKFDY